MAELITNLLFMTIGFALGLIARDVRDALFAR